MITEGRVLQILKKAKLMQLATSVKNQPRVSNVWFGFDKRLNLYFMSGKDILHSKELKKNPKVAGSVAVQKFAVPGKAVMGITFQGKCREIPKSQAREAYRFYLRSPGKTMIPLKEILSGKSRRRLYKVVPEVYMLFDEIDFPEQPRHTLRLRH